MTVETLAAQLRQCREALERVEEQSGPCPVCATNAEHLDACDLANAMLTPAPSPADLATLARQAEIGALVERATEQHVHEVAIWRTTNQNEWGASWTGGRQRLWLADSRLSALRAALSPDPGAEP